MKVDGHVARFRSFVRGYHPVVSLNGRRRAMRGTSCRCSCGWKLITNEDRAYGMKAWLRHVEGAGVARFGFGPARVR